MREPASQTQISGLRPDRRQERRSRVLFLAALVWLVFTCALASWWMIYGIQQLGRLKAVVAGQQGDLGSGGFPGSLERQQTMLITEGAVLILCVLLGGITLLIAIQRETKRARQFQEFFATFSHDLKTALSSLRLQTEAIFEDDDVQKLATEGPVLRSLHRLQADTNRLETQLENALRVAASDQPTHPVLKPARVSDLVQALDGFNPKLSVHYEWLVPNTKLESVELGLESSELENILKNLALNAMKHGKAKSVRLKVGISEPPVDDPHLNQSVSALKLCVWFSDDGRGFQGDRTLLGQKFHRPSGGSGSGLGLYIIDQILRSRGGQFEVLHPSMGSGFELFLTLPILSVGRSA